VPCQTYQNVVAPTNVLIKGGSIRTSLPPKEL
jgi:hypothetical protein